MKQGEVKLGRVLYAHLMKQSRSCSAPALLIQTFALRCLFSFPDTLSAVGTTRSLDFSLGTVGLSEFQCGFSEVGLFKLQAPSLKGGVWADHSFVAPRAIYDRAFRSVAGMVVVVAKAPECQ